MYETVKVVIYDIPAINPSEVAVKHKIIIFVPHLVQRSFVLEC